MQDQHLILQNEIEEQKNLSESNQLSKPYYANPLLIPIKSPEGYVYKWVSLGLFAHERDIDAAMNFVFEGEQGWEAVPHSRHPEMPEEKGFIIWKNTLLAQRYTGPLLEGKITYTWAEQQLRAMMGLDRDTGTDMVHNVPK